jgi:hypothetical protein
MQANPSEHLTNREEDESAQRGVLALILGEHPTQLSISEVLDEVGDDDVNRRAVRDLVSVGLLRRVGDSVLPTRAAICCDVIK